MIIACSYIRIFCGCEKKAWKIFRLAGIRTLDLCETGAALYQLSQLRAGHWIGSFINPWMDDDEGLNIWKSCMWTAEWRKIIAVIYTSFAVAKRKPEKKKPESFFRLSFPNWNSCVYNWDVLPSCSFEFIACSRESELALARARSMWPINYH